MNPGARAQHLGWFAAAIFVIVFGAGEFMRWVVVGWGGNDWWGIDLHLVLDAGLRLEHGQQIYVDEKFLYPPLAAVIGAPLAGHSFDVVSIGYAFVKVAIAVVCVLALAPRASGPVKVLASVTVVATLPFLHDVMLGNANVILVASMVPAVFGSNRRLNGIAFGLAIAIFAKPLALPILLWLLVRRRRTFVGAVLTAASATLFAVMLTGPSAYAAWVQALAGGTRYASAFAGNHGVTALFPQMWLPVALITAAGLAVILIRRGPMVGLTWAAVSGILLAPYAGTYAALPIALAIPGLLVAAPGLALAVVAASPLATTHPLPIYAAAILILALWLPDAAEPGSVALHRRPPAKPVATYRNVASETVVP